MDMFNLKQTLKSLQLKAIMRKVEREIFGWVSDKNKIKMLELIAYVIMLRKHFKSTDVQFPILEEIEFIKVGDFKFFLYIHNIPYCDYPIKAKVCSFPFRFKDGTILLHVYLVAIWGGED